MNIAYVTIYGDVYSKDRIFDINSCKIGQNLLAPGIQLKKEIEQKGYSFHTADMYKLEDIDILIFQDLSNNSKVTIRSFADRIKYILKGKKKEDYLWKAIKSPKKIEKVLIMQEPEVVCPLSYDTQYHKYFDKILTWNPDMLISDKYFLFHYPQPCPSKKYAVQYEKKRFLTMIAGNKSSNVENELYSKRREAISFMDKNNIEFDLYGIGWEKENLLCYKGVVDDKLETLSRYKFCICYENQCNINGYITEKIFDCFFSGVVPIYWGAKDVGKYIPDNCFIDRRKFKTLDELMEYLFNIKESEYNYYIRNIEKYISNDSFYKTFSADAYVKNILGILKI